MLSVDRMIEVLYTKIKENDADIAVETITFMTKVMVILFLYYRIKIIV